MTEPNAAPATEENVTVSKAEYEASKALAGKYKEIEDRAKGIGFESVDDYEDDLLNNYQAPNAPPAAAPAKAPSGTPPTPAAPNAPAANNQELEQMRKQMTSIHLDTQWTAFESRQLAKPETERVSFEKQQLLKLIASPEGVAVAKLAQAPKFGGNIWDAAAYYLTMDPKVMAEQAVKSANAKTESARTAAPPSTTAAPTPMAEDDARNVVAYAAVGMEPPKK